MKTIIIKDTRELKEQMREKMGIKINDKERPQGCDFGDILEAEFGKDKETKAFFEDVDQNGEFKFWVCPNLCRGFVDWDGDKATCRTCGRTNQKKGDPKSALREVWDEESSNRK